MGEPTRYVCTCCEEVFETSDDFSETPRPFNVVCDGCFGEILEGHTVASKEDVPVLRRFAGDLRVRWREVDARLAPPKRAERSN